MDGCIPHILYTNGSTIGHRDYGTVHQLNINKLIQLCVHTLMCMCVRVWKRTQPIDRPLSLPGSHIHAYKSAPQAAGAGQRADGLPLRPGALQLRPQGRYVRAYTYCHVCWTPLGLY